MEKFTEIEADGLFPVIENHPASEEPAEPESQEPEDTENASLALLQEAISEQLKAGVTYEQIASALTELTATRIESLTLAPAVQDSMVNSSEAAASLNFSTNGDADPLAVNHDWGVEPYPAKNTQEKEDVLKTSDDMPQRSGELNLTECQEQRCSPRGQDTNQAPPGMPTERES